MRRWEYNMKHVRINPRHWRLDRHTMGETTLTHEPTELSDSDAKKVLQLEYQGEPLAVEVDPSEVAEEEAEDTADNAGDS